jgi:hypothetical protein
MNLSFVVVTKYVAPESQMFLDCKLYKVNQSFERQAPVVALTVLVPSCVIV